MLGGFPPLILLTAAFTLAQATTTTTTTTYNESLYSVYEFGAGINDKQVLDRLLHKHRYDKRIKPKVKPLQVNILLRTITTLWKKIKNITTPILSYTVSGTFLVWYKVLSIIWNKYYTYQCYVLKDKIKHVHFLSVFLEKKGWPQNVNYL